MEAEQRQMQARLTEIWRFRKHQVPLSAESPPFGPKSPEMQLDNKQFTLAQALLKSDIHSMNKRHDTLRSLRMALKDVRLEALFEQPVPHTLRGAHRCHVGTFRQLQPLLLASFLKPGEISNHNSCETLASLNLLRAELLLHHRESLRRASRCCATLLPLSGVVQLRLEHLSALLSKSRFLCCSCATLAYG